MGGGEGQEKVLENLAHTHDSLIPVSVTLNFKVTVILQRCFFFFFGASSYPMVLRLCIVVINVTMDMIIGIVI